MMEKHTAFETVAVHAGMGKFDGLPVVPPIYQTSTFAFESAERGADLFAGRTPGYIYSRMLNPTVQALEDCLAALEGGHKGLACGSGMAAIHTTLAALLKQGDHVVCGDALYGPTCTLIENVLTDFGITSTVVDTSDLDAVRAALRPNTKLIYVETPGNPTLVITDLPAVAQIAHGHGARLVVDNTFMGPALQQPFALGADVIVHSLTKSLNGHADVVGGAIIVRDEADYALFRRTLNHLGGVLAPMDAFLVHRGIRTLPLRVERQIANALTVAQYLENHEAVEWVRYPGLPSHPQYELGRRQMRGSGGMISIGLCGGHDAGVAMMNAVKLFGLAVSLGGVESLVQHPASMTHACMGPAARRRGHITDGLVRLSIGIEHVDDIIADIEQALQVAMQTHPGATADKQAV